MEMNLEQYMESIRNEGQLHAKIVQLSNTVLALMTEVEKLKKQKTEAKESSTNEPEEI